MVIGTPTVLNLIPGGVMKIIHVNQVNKNIQIQFRIMNGVQPFNMPEGVSGTIRGTKGDNFGYAAAVTVTAGSNIVTVTLTEQLTAVAGAGNVFELVFVGASNNMKVSTENFILAVERAAMGEDTVISDSDLDYANQVLDQLQSVGAVNAQVQQNKANIAAEITRAMAAEQTLQNNINAEAAARQAANNTLQSNINAEASSRATTDASLQSQINQLIAPSGSAPSAAEVENARIGSDGTVYPTLGDAIRTQNSDLKSHLDKIDPYFSAPLGLRLGAVSENSDGNGYSYLYNSTRLCALMMQFDHPFTVTLTGGWEVYVYYTKDGVNHRTTWYNTSCSFSDTAASYTFVARNTAYTSLVDHVVEGNANITIEFPAISVNNRLDGLDTDIVNINAKIETEKDSVIDLVGALTTDVLDYETYTQKSTAMTYWVNDVVQNPPEVMSMMMLDASGVQSDVDFYGNLFVEYTDGTSEHLTLVTALKQWFVCRLNTAKIVSHINMRLKRSNSNLSDAVTSSWTVAIIDGIVNGDIADEIDQLKGKTQFLFNDDANLNTFIQSVKDTQGKYLTLTINTDTHYAQTDLQNEIFRTSAYIANETSMALLNLGDLIRGYDDRTLFEQKTDMVKAVEQYQDVSHVPVLLCKGNHDDASMYAWDIGNKTVEEMITPDIMYPRIMNQMDGYDIVTNPSADYPLYYYIDFPRHKTRLYMLNCIDIPYINTDGTALALGQWDYGYMPEQITWLANTLQSVPSDYMCVFCSHLTFDDTIVGQIPVYNNNVVFNIIKAFKDGTSYSANYDASLAWFGVTGKSNAGYYNGSINVSFADQHDVLCLSGHTHEAQTTLTDGVRSIVFTEFFTAVKSDVLIIDRANHNAIIKAYGYNGERTLSF